jgi:hypothetical protein
MNANSNAIFHYLLVGYIIFYCVFAIFAFIAYLQLVPDKEKKADKPWEDPLDIILIAVGLMGMIFLLTDLHSITMKVIWRPLSITLAITQLYLNLKGRLDLLHSSEAKEGDEVLGYTDFSIILFLLPSIYLNIYYAFR